MAPILKRLRKPSETSPDLATLLEPYGTNDGEAAAEPADPQASEEAEQQDQDS